MIRSKGHKFMVWLVAALALSATGCSVFITTPQTASYHIQQLDDQLVEVVINLDTPTETDLDIRISNRYALQLEFEWLWNLEDQEGLHTDVEVLSEDSALTPWMLCKYRF